MEELAQVSYMQSDRQYHNIREYIYMTGSAQIKNGFYLVDAGLF